MIKAVFDRKGSGPAVYNHGTDAKTFRDGMREAGVDYSTLAPELDRFLDQQDALIVEVRKALAADAKKARDGEIVRALARGELTPGEALTENFRSMLEVETEGAGKGILTRAGHAAGEYAWAEVKRPGERWLTELLAPEVERLAAESLAAYDELGPGVETAEAAIAAKKADAWATLGTNDARWREIVEVVTGSLVDGGVVPIRVGVLDVEGAARGEDRGRVERAPSPEFWLFAEPWNLPWYEARRRNGNAPLPLGWHMMSAGLPHNQPAPVDRLELALAAKHGAKPTLRTAREAGKVENEIRERRAAALMRATVPGKAHVKRVKVAGY